MATALLTELRLGAFKSFRGATLPLGQTTVLTGRNSSGKSNALDGLEVLARLAEGDDLADALDGRRRDGGAVRGGSKGCAPHGLDHFSLGCVVHAGEDRYVYELRVEVDPDLRVVYEKLSGPVVAANTGHVKEGPLLETRPAGAPGTGIEAEIHNGRRGPNPLNRFRDSRLILAQAALLLTGKDAPERSVIRGVEVVLTALRGVFHFDPVPHLMRDFVQGRSVELRRTGENLSPALKNLQRVDSAAFEQVRTLVRQIADENIKDVTFVSSDLGDVMVALDESPESGAGPRQLSPARQMSDGLLRFMGIATALLSSKGGLDISPELDGVADDNEVNGGVLIVLEELENGLHPSQAQRVLDLVKESSRSTGSRVLLTTHSPALLDAAEGELNHDVIVCHRDAQTGISELTQLTKLPGYAAALAEGSLGSAVTAGKLVRPVEPNRDYSEFERLLGLR